MSTHPLANDPHQSIVEFIDSGNPFAIATVLNDAGSTPRKAGTKAIVDSMGSIWGTIGGGLLEDQAKRVAVESITTKQPVVFDFKFAGTSAGENKPICGGNMRILIDPTAQQRRATYFQAAEARQHRCRGAMLTSINRTDKTHVDVHWLSESAIAEHHGFPASEKINQTLSTRAAILVTQETARSTTHLEALIEPLIPSPRLIIVGGGHVGQALARQASIVGFELIIIEDRPEFSDPSLFPDSAQVHCADPGRFLTDFPIDPDTYIALVNRGHRQDIAALAACLRSPAAYIGMMGSRRKVALCRKEFLESGLAKPEDWQRLHAPIGLDIGAETVPEIAASIVAQLISVLRTGKSPGFSMTLETP